MTCLTRKTFFFPELYIFFSANILLDEDFTAKISDFGLARASEKFSQTVMTSRIVGTTAYMAPEALRGEITPKSDIYSFGVVSFIYIISNNNHSCNTGNYEIEVEYFEFTCLA